MARLPLVAANWKMNGSLASNDRLLAALRPLLDGISCQVLICPPSLYIAQVRQSLVGSAVRLGAQNVYSESSGAFTGEISGEMLKDFEVTDVLVGHSERRELFGESDAVVSAKFAAVQRAGLRPILCVGETLAEREAGQTEAIIARQLHAVIEACGVDSLSQAVVAYEPVWAIGTGQTASPQQAQQVHAFIRRMVADEASGVAEILPVLYGGSVKSANAAELFAEQDIDGALVGGASLDAEEFANICRAASRPG